MTVTEFKKLKSEYKNIDGNQLWDAMENYGLQLQQGNKMLKTIMPIWKTHTLRWLFYRKVPNLIIGNFKTDKWVSDDRCKSCKKGVNNRIIFSIRREDGVWESNSLCPHCNEKYIAEPNINFSHKLWKLYNIIINIFWIILDKIHLVRSSIGGRYEMMGDEEKYVENWVLNEKSKSMDINLKKRKWWEYILIEKPSFNYL